MDGASNMTGRIRGAVKNLQSGCIPGFIRIWCAAHQLDLVVQEIIIGAMKKDFRDLLLKLISHLRRQATLRA